MSLKVKVGGAYVDPVGVLVKVDGAYAVKPVSVKVDGAYQSVSGGGGGGPTGAVTAAAIGTSAARTAGVTPDLQTFPVTSAAALLALGGAGAVAVVPAVVTYSGTPSVIHVRSVDFDTGAEVTPWALFANAPTGGTASGACSMKEYNGYQKLQFRAAASGAADITTTTRIGAGILCGIEDQSQGRYFIVNTNVGFPTGGSITPNSLVSVYAKSGLLEAVEGGNGADPTFGVPAWYALNSSPSVGGATLIGGGGSGAAALGNQLVAALGVPVGFVLCAAGGRTIDYLNTTAKPETLARYAEAGRPNYIGFVSHGSADVALATSYGTYKAGLEALKTWHDGDAFAKPREKYVVLNLIGQLTGGGTQNIRTARQQWVLDHPADMISGGGTYDVWVQTDDGVHQQDVNGNAVMGARFALAVLKDLGLSSAVGSRGPLVASVARSGATVTVSTTLRDGATALAASQADASGSAMTAQGWRVEKLSDSSSLTINSISIVGTTVVLTLAADPGEAVRVKYGYSFNPGPRAITDNVATPGQTKGGSLEYELIGVSESIGGGGPTAAPTITGGGLTLVGSWDYGDPSKQTVVAGAVTAQAGSDGTAFTLLAPTAGPVPTSRLGTPATRFTAASSQFLQLLSDLGANAAGAVTIVTIYEPAATGVLQSIADLSNGAAAANRERHLVYLNSSASGASGRKANASATSDPVSGLSYSAARHITVEVSNPGSSACTLYHDGVGTGVNGGAVAFPTTITHFTSGARRVSGANEQFFDGWKFREFVYLGAATAAQAEQFAVWSAANYFTPNKA